MNPPGVIPGSPGVARIPPASPQVLLTRHIGHLRHHCLSFTPFRVRFVAYDRAELRQSLDSGRTVLMRCGRRPTRVSVAACGRRSRNCRGGGTRWRSSGNTGRNTRRGRDPGITTTCRMTGCTSWSKPKARLVGGVFGRIAAGENQMFWPANPGLLRKTRRREDKRSRTAREHAGMGRSEELASLCQVLWEMRAGLRSSAPEWFSRVPDGTAESPVVRRILARLDSFVSQWHAPEPGRSMTLEWPRLASRG
jgi:hypothetical protein